MSCDAIGMTWMDGMTIIIALFGLGLGIYNAIVEWRRSRAGLSVRAVWHGVIKDAAGHLHWFHDRGVAAVAKYPEGKIGIEVVNSGHVAVFVGQVGFCSAPTRRLGRLREPEIQHGFIYKPFPEPLGTSGQLPPWAVVTLPTPSGANDLPDMREFTHVYIKTQHGRTFYGPLPFTRELTSQ